MRIVGRLLRILLVVLVVVAGVVTGIVGAVTIRALPQQDGAIQIPGLGTSVTVLRDANGIVNIYADSPHDLFLAQGYVHAQERLWQMEVWRHISAGRLSELFGASTLDEDQFIRTLGWRRRRGARSGRALAPDRGRRSTPTPRASTPASTRTAGAWGWRSSSPALKAGIGGVGGYDLEPWTALDSLAWQKVQAWQLGGNFDSEVFRMLADEKLGDPKLTDALFPPYGASMPVITPSTQAVATRSTASNSATSSPTSRATAATSTSPASDAGWRDVADGRSAGSSRSPASTPAAGSSATTRSARTTG